MKRLRRTLIVFSLIVLSAVLVPACLTGFFGAFGGNGAAETVPPESVEGAVQGAQETLPQEVQPEPATTVPGPKVAICVDDTGNNLEHMDEWLAIDAPVTFAVMPKCPATESAAEMLSAAGQQIILHMPEENDQGDGGFRITTSMTQAEVNAMLDLCAAQLTQMIGMNQHQGSKAGNDMDTQRRVVAWAKSRGYFVMDSMASTKPVVYKAAVEAGMPLRASNVFIDHDNDPAYIRKAMRQLADIAKKRGTAIGICHFGRPNTARTVGEMIEVLEQEGITFEFVSNVSNQP
ncbi:MAG: divergent polysaccharide deacetylase family protein [Candidatus Geothermincolia bacterium]